MTNRTALHPAREPSQVGGALKSYRTKNTGRSIIQNSTQGRVETTTWPELAESLYSFLTGRGASIEYRFEDMIIGVPSAAHPDAPQALWRLNGGLTIRTTEK